MREQSPVHDSQLTPRPLRFSKRTLTCPDLVCNVCEEETRNKEARTWECRSESGGKEEGMRTTVRQGMMMMMMMMMMNFDMTDSRIEPGTKRKGERRPNTSKSLAEGRSPDEECLSQKAGRKRGENSSADLSCPGARTKKLLERSGNSPTRRHRSELCT